MSSGRYALLILSLMGWLLRPSVLWAQPKLIGWGPFHLGTTTPDSLPKNGFREQPQPLVKGTIALPCSHIRVFQTDTLQLENQTVSNVSLTFYDDNLFKIDCDGSAVVQRAFRAAYGKGATQPLDTIRLCEGDKPMFMKREVWQYERAVALFVKAEGYTATCQPVSFQKLVIVDQRVLALTSECDVKDGYLVPISKH